MQNNASVCYIIGAAEVSSLPIAPQSGDMVIAADGGWLTLKRFGVAPDIVIGDFDSSPEPIGADILRLNPIKDITDTKRAVDYGMEKGYRRFHIFGCLGGRTAHTLANIQMMSELVERGCECRLFGDSEVFTAVHNGAIRFDKGSSGYISVFSLSDRSCGVCERGLKYLLEDYEMIRTYPIGVSNEFIGDAAEIAVKDGTLLIVFTDKAALSD